MWACLGALLSETLKAQGWLQAGRVDGTEEGSAEGLAEQWLRLLLSRRVPSGRRSVGVDDGLLQNTLLRGAVESVACCWLTTSISTATTVCATRDPSSLPTFPLLQVLGQVFPPMGVKALLVLRAQPVCFALMRVVCAYPYPSTSAGATGGSPAGALLALCQACSFINRLFDHLDPSEVSMLLLAPYGTPNEVSGEKRTGTAICASGKRQKRGHGAGPSETVQEAEDDMVVECLPPAKATLAPTRGAAPQSSAAASAQCKTTAEQRQVGW
jgi:hypothetical protein